jgi:hypothetical protein
MEPSNTTPAEKSAFIPFVTKGGAILIVAAILAGLGVLLKLYAHSLPAAIATPSGIAVLGVVALAIRNLKKHETPTPDDKGNQTTSSASIEIPPSNVQASPTRPLPDIYTFQEYPQLGKVIVIPTRVLTEDIGSYLIHYDLAPQEKEYVVIHHWGYFNIFFIGSDGNLTSLSIREPFTDESWEGSLELFRENISRNHLQAKTIDHPEWMNKDAQKRESERHQELVSPPQFTTENNERIMYITNNLRVSIGEYLLKHKLLPKKGEYILVCKGYPTPKKYIVFIKDGRPVYQEISKDNLLSLDYNELDGIKREHSLRAKTPPLEA